MSKKTLFTLACIIGLSACNNPRLVANEQMRQKADVVMRAIMQQHDEAVYASLAAQVKLAYSKEESVAPLVKARVDFGEISAYQLKNISAGVRYARSKRMEMVRYWYATTNKRCPFACFTQIDITLENGVPSLAGFEQVRFADDHIPAELL